jgi:hypothetical protein
VHTIFWHHVNKTICCWIRMNIIIHVRSIMGTHNCYLFSKQISGNVGLKTKPVLDSLYVRVQTKRDKSLVLNLRDLLFFWWGENSYTALYKHTSSYGNGRHGIWPYPKNVFAQIFVSSNLFLLEYGVVVPVMDTFGQIDPWISTLLWRSNSLATCLFSGEAPCLYSLDPHYSAQVLDVC